MTTEAPAKTHCPNCGAKLHRLDLSLCAYCATPLALGGRAATDDDTVRRLKRMREHAGWPAAEAARPFDPQVLARMNRANSAGWALVIAGTALALLRIATAGRISAADPLLLAPLVLLALGLARFARAATWRARERSLPLVRRPALVVDRRSETGTRRDGPLTTYYFTMRFDDGSEGEFRWPGQGTSYEPWANGTAGVAYTRGADLIEFRKL